MRTGASALAIRPQPAPMALTPAAPSAGGMGLEGLVDLVLSNIWRLVLGVLAALIAGLAYLALSEPRFTASAALFIDPRTRKIVTEDTVQNSTINDTALFESQVSIIGSEAILRRVVERLDLVNDPEFASAGGNGLLATVRSRVSGTPVPSQADPLTRATERLSRNVRVRRAQNTYVVTIEAVSASPQKAARIANEISSAYLDDQAASKSESAARVNSLIDSRLDELRTQLRKAETSVDDFKRQNKIVTSEGGMLNEQRLTRLNTELVAVRGIVASTRARLDELAALVKRSAGPESLPEAMASPTLQRLREQYSSVARREAALASQLQPRHPLLVDVRAQLATARREITAELQRVAAATNSEFQIAATREREIQRELERIEGEVAVTTTAQIRLREFEREAEAAREILRAFLTRAKETQEQQNLSVADARVITVATMPLRPSAPQPVIVLGFAGILGLGAGLLAAALRHGGSSAPTSRQRAPVPLAQSRMLQMAGQILCVPDSVPLPPSARPLEPYAQHLNRVAIALDPNGSPAAAGFRRATDSTSREILRQAGPDRPAVALFASPLSGAGTTTAAFAVALSAARRGLKTLIVDADARDAHLSLAFAEDLAQARPCVLDSKDDLAGILSRDPQSGLALLPIALADLPTLSDRQLQRLAVGIARLSGDYDLVVIDGGAQPASAAAVTLSAICGLLVVVAPDGTPDSVTGEVPSALGLGAGDRAVAVTALGTCLPRAVAR